MHPERGDEKNSGPAGNKAQEAYGRIYFSRGKYIPLYVLYSFKIAYHHFPLVYEVFAKADPIWFAKLHSLESYRV